MGQTAYANYKSFQVIYDTGTHRFDVRCGAMGTILESFGLDQITLRGTEEYDLDAFSEATWTCGEDSGDGHGVWLRIRYSGCSFQNEMILTFRLTCDTLSITYACPDDLDLHLSGRIRWGVHPGTDTFPVNLNRSGFDLRAALGPASGYSDHALFDRQTDSALELLGCRSVRLGYDWDLQDYRVCLQPSAQDQAQAFWIRIHQHVYQERFGIAYKPYNRQNTFGTPPAGWMTWYAVQFNACEDTVLENARWMAANLKKYGANCIWVDWEWYHKDFTGTHREGVDVFHPDPERYPRGLAHVAAEIRKLGLIPALWIGASNDVNQTEFIRDNPGVVLCVKPSWCGRYFLDPSHPKVVHEYIPQAFRQLLDWGYKALKWDCFPITLQICDENHALFYDPGVSTEDALRRLVQKARETVGDAFYMLSCSGGGFRQITMAIDLFDAMRIGGDIFAWDEFVSQCIDRVMKYYAFHNIVCLNDPDNLVIRPQYNTDDEAVSRASLVGLLGLPVTYGDDLPALPEERVELLRRVTPPLDIHPLDIRENACDGRVVKIGLSICMPYEQWHVLGILNIQDHPTEVLINLQADANLDPADPAEYLVFDFWNKHYLGSFKENVPIRLRAHATRVLSVRRRLDRPQLVSTSRHISQGAAEIQAMIWDNDRHVLSGISSAVENEPYELFIHIPRDYSVDPAQSSYETLENGHDGVCRIVFPVYGNQAVAWKIAFSKTDIV
ncbi:MAG: alpha-galactosidase [Clostridiaceae bacterium]|jgi:hypothetical protein|nr:alpha-galactosidase [Clostridiaceae bacterium]